MPGILGRQRCGNYNFLLEGEYSGQFSGGVAELLVVAQVQRRLENVKKYKNGSTNYTITRKKISIVIHLLGLL